MARSWLSGPDCIYLHNKPAWDGKRAPLSSLTHLDLQNTFCFASSKNVLDSLSEWRCPISGSRLTWGPRKGGGALGGWAGLWVSAGPTWGIEERWWHVIQAELSAWAGSVQVTPGLLLTFAPGEKWHSKKYVTQWQWLNQLFLQNIRSQLECGIWVSDPSPALFTVQSTSSNKTTAKYGLLGGSSVSPRLQNHPPHVPGSALSCLLATPAPSKVMLHVIARWFTALFGFSGSWAHVYQQNTHSPVSGFKQIGAIQNAFEQDALHSQA